ncbi:MAG: XrtA-associated tyrosine autokinase [Candidatus Competibacter denitrificans]
MDSIEKAMFGRSVSAVTRPPAVIPPVPQSREDVIERAVNLPSSAPITSPNLPEAHRRTRRSVTLDMERIRASGLLVPDSQRSRIKEEYRQIKRPLLMNVDGKGAAKVDHPNLIGVTSARAGEGKTFTACNLALSIASERNRTVLLVDADILRPAVAKMLGFEADQGLVDFLADDQMELADVLVSTNMSSLTILPAGSKHHLSAELLAGDNMHRLTAEMSQRYPDRIVIFDAPPLLATTEARILASLMGQVVMVVEAERTLQAHVKEALSLLNPNQISGFVLNKSRDLIASGYYGKDYGHPYDHDGQEFGTSPPAGSIG